MKQAFNKLSFIPISLLNDLLRQIILIFIILIISVSSTHAFCMENNNNLLALLKAAHGIATHTLTSEELHELLAIINNIHNTNQLTETRQLIAAVSHITNVDLNLYLIPQLQHDVISDHGNSDIPVTQTQNTWSDVGRSLLLFFGLSLFVYLVYRNREILFDLFLNITPQESIQGPTNIRWDALLRDLVNLNNPEVNQALRELLRITRETSINTPTSA